MNLYAIRNRLKSEFVRNVLTLFSGTALAQIIPLVVTPFLTRLYSPSDYGLLAVYVAVTSLIAVASTLRFDIAILMPAEDDDAMTMTLLTIICVLCVSFLMTAVLLIFHSRLAGMMVNGSMEHWLYVMPVSVMLIGFSSALNYWLNRRKKFRQLAVNRVAVALVASSINLALGYYGVGYSGLILGLLVSQAVGLFMLFIWTWREVLDGVIVTQFISIKRLAKEYSKFPRYSLPSDFVNYLSQQLPALMMSRFFGSTVVGHFSFSQKILGMPLNLMSQSICDVFKQRASSDFNTYGNCRQIFNSTFKTLTALSIAPSIVIVLFAPLIFKVVFGSEWEQAGHYTRYLSILYFFRFIVSPLSYMFFIANRQESDLIGQSCLLVVTVGSMFLGIYFKDPDRAIICFSVGYSFIYGIYFLVAHKLSGGILKG